MIYVLIDLENVMPDDFSRLNREDVRTYLFAGKLQEKIKLATVMAVQPLGDKVKWIQMVGSGKNALDFHLAFYLGTLFAKDPKGEYYFVSNDKGFDPLVTHVKSLGGVASRIGDLKKLPALAKAAAQKTAPKVTVKMMADDLKARKCRTVLRVKNAIKSCFNKQDSAEVDRIFDMMAKKGFLAVDANGHVTWPEVGSARVGHECR